jgi:hypothetical protein
LTTRNSSKLRRRKRPIRKRIKRRRISSKRWSKKTLLMNCMEKSSKEKKPSWKTLSN